MDKERKELWNFVFDLIENNTDSYLLNKSYYDAKIKILKDSYKDVQSDEFKSLWNALKVAEINTHKSGYEGVAHALRRVAFHSDEEGFYEFAYLKDKYGGCYIATAVYGSYDSPQVLLLRKFRDLYLEKRQWGRKFVMLYYKYSPKVAQKISKKKLFNLFIRFVLNNFLLRFAVKKIGEENV